MKKVFCIALSLILIFALAVPAFAEAPVDDALFAQIKETAAVDFPEGTYEVNQIGRLIVFNVYGEDAFASAALLIGFGDLADPSWEESLAEVCEVQQRYQAMVGSEADDPVVLLNCFDTETRFLLFSVCEGTVLYDLSKTTIADQVTEAPAEQAEAPVEKNAPADGAELTMGQKNAVRSAQDYLSFTAFSRTGLINQLEFDGYSHEDAEFAVDHITVDWFEQAVQSAEDYLAFTSFSRDGLIGQLEFDGFTREQAEYAVTQVGY